MIPAPKEIIWLFRVRSEAETIINNKVQLRSDNQVAINWVNGERCPLGLAKHIAVRIHFIRELVQSSKVRFDYASSEKIKGTS